MYGADGTTIFGPSGCDVCATGYDGKGRDEIEAIQTSLVSLGYLTPSSITGQYGAKTYDAVQQFQAAYGLEVDGRVGPNTLGMLLEQGRLRREASSGAKLPLTPPASPEPSTFVALTQHKMFYPALIGSVLLVAGAVYFQRSKK